MKIAFICTEKLPVPPIRGGAIQQYIDGILPYIKERHQVTVYSVADPEFSHEEDNRDDNVRYIRIKGKNTPDYISNIINRIENDYDLIHVFNRPKWVNMLDKKLRKTEISLSIHNEMFRPSKLPEDEGKKCIKRVKFISTVSRFIADGIKELYPDSKSKVHPVYSGVDINRYQPIWSEEAMSIRNQLKKKYGLMGKKVVLFVGRLSPKKGAHILINAMKEVISTHPDTALVLVGSKWYGNNQEDSYVKRVKQAAEELDTDVILTGFLPPAEISSYYYLGDVFVCASQWMEPLARVHYEAMAAGLPIITTDRGGNAEVVRGLGNGIVITEYNRPKAFASAISFLLDQREIALEMGRAGRQLAEEKYSWERVAAELMELFEA